MAAATIALCQIQPSEDIALVTSYISIPTGFLSEITSISRSGLLNFVMEQVRQITTVNIMRRLGVATALLNAISGVSKLWLESTEVAASLWKSHFHFRQILASLPF